MKNMKKMLLCLATTMFLLLSFFPNQLKAVTMASPMPTDSTRTVETTVYNAMMLRLNEIRDMDKSKLTRAEKKELRKEVRSMQKQAKAVSGGVYISATTLIVILILLIILT